MCRLVAYAGPDCSPEPLVFGGDHSLYRQSFAPRELLSGSVNADGFSAVWYRDPEPVRLASPFPIWQDPDLRGLLASVTSGVVVAAVRNVTDGIPTAPTGIAPITVDRWSFVFNGFVEGFRTRFMRTIHSWIPDPWFGRLTGVSDTEALGLVAASACAAGASPSEALYDLVTRVRSLVAADGAGAQLNMVLTDGKTVAASRASSEGASNSLYRSTDSPLAPDGLLVASEALGCGGRWASVASGTVFEWDREGRIVDERSL